MRRLVMCLILLSVVVGWHIRVHAETLRTPKIVGGTEATPNEFPFMAYIYFSGSITSHRCGGTLIAPTWVLTAAHCVSGASASQYRVAMGMHSRYGSNPYAQTSAISRVITHASYDASIYDYDIALLELATPMTMTAQVGVAQLGFLPTAATLYADGAITTVAGWGTVSYGGSSSSTLRKVSVPVVINSHCDDTYINISQPITTRMMCAGDYDNGGIDACQGDSGGPLFTVDASVFTVVGIVSSGEGCAWPDYPGIYTRVSFFQSWITSYTGALGPVETLTPSQTPTTSNTPTRTNTRTASRTATSSNTPTQTPTASDTATRTATRTPTRTATRTPTPTVTPTPLPIAVKRVASGASFSVAALYNGTLVSWGFNSQGQSTIPLGLATLLFDDVAAGNNYTIALSRAGRVYGWGANDYKQLNIPIAAQSGVTSIAAGPSHVLAIKAGSVLCWGSDLSKQCSGKPAGLSGVVAVAAGNGYSLALKSSGKVIGWGKNTAGQVSIPSTAASHIVGISAGTDHALALRNTGTVIGWGNNSIQQAIPPLGLKDVYAISAGNGFSLALKRNGSVVGWGQPSHGQLSIPVTNNAVSIAAGMLNSVIGLRNGSVLVVGSAALDANRTRTPTRTR